MITRAFWSAVYQGGVVVVVLAVGVLTLNIVGAIRTHRAFSRVIPEYLARIKYVQRVEQARRRAAAPHREDGDGPAYWATGNYDPVRYYAETRGITPEYQNYVREAYGDLDMCESNKPD